MVGGWWLVVGFRCLVVCCFVFWVVRCWFRAGRILDRRGARKAGPEERKARGVEHPKKIDQTSVFQKRILQVHCELLTWKHCRILFL